MLPSDPSSYSFLEELIFSKEAIFELPCRYIAFSCSWLSLTTRYDVGWVNIFISPFGLLILGFVILILEVPFAEVIH